MRVVFWYAILFALLSIFLTAHPWAAEGGKRNKTPVIVSMAGAKRVVVIEPEMIYIGDDGGVGLEYSKKFTLRSIGGRNILSLQVAGMVSASNGGDSKDYHNGFYTNALYINGRYVDNVNNYVYHDEEGKQFRTILIPLPSRFLRPGPNKLTIKAGGPKEGNHDDFVLKEIKLYQWVG